MKLSEFKKFLKPGMLVRLVKSELYNKNSERYEDTYHATVGDMREVKKVRSRDIMFVYANGERAGKTVYCSWPPASGFERTQKGFVFSDPEKFGTRLTYEFVE